MTPAVEHVRMFVGSRKWGQRAQQSDARAAGGSLRGDFPRYVRRAKGAYVWDVDGNKYVDYILGFGPVVLGHADERVYRAVVEQLELGV